jgi:hypothetical protein
MNILEHLFFFWTGAGAVNLWNELLKERLVINNKLLFKLFLYGPAGWLIILIMASCYIAGYIKGAINFIIRKIFLDKRAK